MKTIQTVVYEFDELSEKAKEKARDWYREAAIDYNWWEDRYYDAKCIGLKLTGFDTERGDKAEGYFIESALDTMGKILHNHGKTTDTYKTAKRYEPALRLDTDPESVEYQTTAQEFLTDLLRDYLAMLRADLEYLYSEESVDENIRGNEYTFTEAGKRFG